MSKEKAPNLNSQSSPWLKTHFAGLPGTQNPSEAGKDFSMQYRYKLRDAENDPLAAQEAAQTYAERTDRAQGEG